MPRLFRADTLSNLNNQADDLSIIIPDRHISHFWPGVFVISLGIVFIFSWLLTAGVAVTVESRGILLHLGGIREITSTSEGVVIYRSALDKDNIQAGDIILKTSSPALIKEHEDARRQYLSQKEILVLEKKSNIENNNNKNKEFKKKLSSTQESLTSLIKLKNRLEKAVLKHQKKKAFILSSQQRDAELVADLYQKMESNSQLLFDDNLVSDYDYANLQSNRVSALRSLSSIDLDISSFRLNELEFEKELNRLNSSINQELAEELELKRAQEEAFYEVELQKKDTDLRMMTARDELLRAESLLWSTLNVFSPYDGQIISVKKAPGQHINKGESVALLNITSQKKKLFLIISPRADSGYVEFGFQGKVATVPFQKDSVALAANLALALSEIMPAQDIDIRVADGNVVIGSPNGGFNSLQHLTLRNTALKDNDGVPAFSDLIVMGADWNEKGLTAVAILPPENGKRVKVGDSVLIKPDNEKSLVGTQVRAHVYKVSNYVATAIQAQAIIGSEELSQTLMGEGGGILAFLELDRKPNGELILDGDVLNRPLTAGTITTNYIVVDVESPINIVLPFYADLFD
jgi:multidrug efflux pump subunit AcrA (membrane-fusion protein)